MRLRTLLTLALAAPIALTGCDAVTSSDLASPEATSQQAHLAKMEAEHGVRLVDMDTEARREALTSALSASASKGPGGGGPDGYIVPNSSVTSSTSGSLKRVDLEATTFFKSYVGRVTDYWVEASYRNVGANNGCNVTPQEFLTESDYREGTIGTALVSETAFYNGVIKWEIVAEHGALIVGGGGPQTTSDVLCY